MTRLMFIIIMLIVTSEMALCQAEVWTNPSSAPLSIDTLAQPDCVTDPQDNLKTRCYQSYEEEAAHSILSRFHAMNGHYNFSKIGWTNTSHPCKTVPQWLGVGCEERLVNHGSGDYFEVSLTSWNMEQFCIDFTIADEGMGGLPVEFGNLTNLHTMIVRNCSMLYGVVPNKIIHLPWLKVLDLSSNNLNGSMQGILDINFSFHEMEQIDLSKNRLFGELPLPYQMDTLQALDLSQNIFNTLSPDWCSINISFYSKLKYLNFSNNNLRGTFCLDNVRSIEKVDISGNHFSSMIASNLSSLNTTGVAIKYLFAKNNSVGIFPTDSVLQWPTLEEINLDDNIISGVLSLPYVYTATSNLATISLVNNNISDLTWRSQGETSLLDERHLRNLELILLLGGNPICNSPPKNDEMKDLLRIVCRSDKTSPIPDPYRTNRKLPKFWIKMIASTGTITVIVLCIILTYVANKLRKQTMYMQNIQRELFGELSRREVNPKLYAFSELRNATQDFHRENKLGEGAFGIVYKGILSDGSMVAIKRLKKATETIIHDFLNEIVIISSIKHRNLVQLKGCCITSYERILVYELVNNKNLAEALWEGPMEERCNLDWKARFNIIIGIAEGLVYLHKKACQTVVHRDIKPPNILLDDDLNPKIADFGIALLFPDLLDDETHQSVTRITGTRGYIPHEYASLGQVSPKLDVFSYGVLLLEIVSGRKCIDCKLPIPQSCLYDWAQRLYTQGRILELIDATISDDLNPTDLDTIQRVLIVGLWCTNYLPTSRPSMPEVLDMLWGKIPHMAYQNNHYSWIDSLHSLQPIQERNSFSISPISPFNPSKSKYNKHSCSSTSENMEYIENSGQLCVS